MSTSIDQAFVKQFESEVFMAYQRTGSKLRGTIRTQTKVQGQDITFFKAGKGSASTKSRHGTIPVMNAAHSNVVLTLTDYYGADWVDKLDLLKTNIDERMIVAQSGAYALGRKTDDLIVTAMQTSTTSISGAGATGLDITRVLKTFEQANNTDIPDDGNRFFVVGAQQWNNLLSITQFASADYVGYEQAPFMQGISAKRWMGILFFFFSGLPVTAASGGTRTCFMYHRAAAGHGIAADIQTDITWHGDRAAWFVNNMMSMGAQKIDDVGIIKVPCLETATP